jgi:hypothetical protein
MKRTVLLVPLALLVAPSLAAPRSPSPPDLARRIRAQAALEEVYWRHRVWPETNVSAKPPLREVLSEEVLRTKALDPLRKSAALETLWNRPITAAALQSEINRMVRSSHRPDMLRELFAALDDNPTLIAECLARPLVADRLVRRWYAWDQRMHETARLRAESARLRTDSVEDLVRTGGTLDEYRVARAEDGVSDPPPGTRSLDAQAWRSVLSRLAADLGESSSGSDLPDARMLPRGRLSPLREDEDRFYVAVVLESEANSLKVAEVAWPKRSFDDWWHEAGPGFSATPPLARADYIVPTPSESSCAVGTWNTLHQRTPAARVGHTAVWTGSEMLVWGGYGPTADLGLPAGARYDPATDEWSVMGAGAGSPAPRRDHTAVWTGTRMIVWGGVVSLEPFLPATGGIYDPITDTWIPTRSDATAPVGRIYHSVVWTGSRMVVWGGRDTSGHMIATGGRYDPATDTWLPTRLDATTPSARGQHTAIWTGSRMIVWGGR